MCASVYKALPVIALCSAKQEPMPEFGAHPALVLAFPELVRKSLVLRRTVPRAKSRAQTGRGREGGGEKWVRAPQHVARTPRQED
jgi:hypothetical protein